MARGKAAASLSSGAGGHSELVRGYKLLRLPVASGSPISRSLLVKKHEARDPAERESAARTLFVTHLDSFAQEAQLQRCFSSFGPVEKVELKTVEKKAPKAEQRADHVKVHVVFARIVFKDTSSMQKALDAATGRITAHAVFPSPPSLLKERLRAQKTLYPDPLELRREIDTWMANYDEHQQEKRRQAKETQVDEDGFTKVVSGITRTADGLVMRGARRQRLKTGAFADSVGGSPADEDVSAGKKKHKSKEMPDFYRFQQREKRRDEIMDHRKRHAEDVETVKLMRKSKRFKAQVPEGET
eukprot:TRINITY_DN37063_c0_g1_i1.p1 TRINITY_DN37063_c0_g1~~TRINITY_DN37063_c0_g1_i1.p1  ORF type:complete len:313 (+),score=95.76 TRINITY_DN37063_c0_g1_i1:41-940(+)